MTNTHPGTYDEASFAEAVQQLIEGQPIRLVATGTSMRPRIESGKVLTISPVDPSAVRVDDIVLVKWKKGRLLAHLVMEIRNHRFKIGNTWGKTNGWVDAEAILGRATDVSDVCGSTKPSKLVAGRSQLYSGGAPRRR